MALEYDVVGVEGSPAPGVFLRSAADGGYTDPGFLPAAVAAAAGWNEEAPERRGVARVLAALPPRAAVRWAGAFPDREMRAVCLLVRGLVGGGAAFLDRIGRPGDTSAIDEIVSAFHEKGVDNHVLALDATEEGVLPGLGLELSRPGRTHSGWGMTLDMMARKRWCLPEKATALARATRSERIFSRAGVSELQCGIHHVKLAFRAGGESGLAVGDGAAAAKGYVACVLKPLS